MPVDAEELIAQQNKERKREEARVAQLRQWDRTKDQRIVSMGFIYGFIAFVLRFYLAEFFNYQQLDPGKALERGGGAAYAIINFSLFFMLGPINMNKKTWKDMWRPAQYAIALAVYLMGTYLRYRFPPREFHEAQITQMFFVSALILDMILLCIYWLHTYSLFRRKYLPDCLASKDSSQTMESLLIGVSVIIFLLSSHWFGAYIAPDLPKFFH